MIHMAKPLLGEAEEEAVLGVLRSGMLAQGAKVAEFEQAFAEYIGVEHAIATSSGTTALHLALLAAGVGEGDEVITTPFTFIATANAILYVGATPVFADIDALTYNINPAMVEMAITERTRAILPVHLYGLPANMAEINDIARRHDLLVIEDACQAHGALFMGTKVGAFGDAACFSFYPTKNMTTGEGGMITTNDSTIADRARMLRQHGMQRRYYHEMLGYNFRMTDIAAAIGLVQLGRLDEFNQTRQANAAFLTDRIRKAEGIRAPYIPFGYSHVFHQYTIWLDEGIDRDELRRRLKEAGFGSEIYYPIPIHLQSHFLGEERVYLPVAEEASRRVLSLPIHPSVGMRDLSCIVGTLRSFLAGADQI